MVYTRSGKGGDGERASHVSDASDNESREGSRAEGTARCENSADAVPQTEMEAMKAQLSQMRESQLEMMRHLADVMCGIQGMGVHSKELPWKKDQSGKILVEDKNKKSDQLLEGKEKAIPWERRSTSEVEEIERDIRSKTVKRIEQMTRNVGDTIALSHLSDWVTQYKTMIEVQVKQVVRDVDSDLSGEVGKILCKEVHVDEINWKINRIVRDILGKIKFNEKESNQIFSEIYQDVSKDKKCLECENLEIQRMRLIDDEIHKWMKSNATKYLRKLDEILFYPRRESYREFMSRYLRILNIAHPNNFIPEGIENQLIRNLFTRVNGKYLEDAKTRHTLFLNQPKFLEKAPSIGDALNYIQEIYDQEPPPMNVQSANMRYEVKQVNFRRRRTPTCYRCGKTGHLRRDCKQPAPVKKKENGGKPEVKDEPVEKQSKSE